MVFENSKIICTAESFLGLFNRTVACINGNQKQHTIVQSLSTGVYPTVFLFGVPLQSLSACPHKFLRTCNHCLFLWPWLLASSFPSNTDIHLFKSIDVPIVTDSFGGKSKFNVPVGTKMHGSGGVAGRKKWWERVFRLTDHKAFSNNIFKGCIILHSVIDYILPHVVGHLGGFPYLVS